MKKFPKYPPRPHKSGRARIWLNGKHVYLGKFGSDESRKEYARLAAIWAAGKLTAAAVSHDPNALTVDGLCLLFEEHVTQEYPTGSCEPVSFRAALAVVRRLFGPTPAAAFDLASLRTVQEAMVSGSWITKEEQAARRKAGKPERWSQRYINRQVTRVRTFFRWAENRKYVSPGTWDSLRALSPVAKSKAPRRGRRKPVAWETVKATLRHLPPVLKAVVLVQWWSGARPSQVTGMLREEVDTSGPEWVWTPDKHKNAWRDQPLTIVLGPKARAALRPWLLKATGYVFPPAKRTKGARHSHYTWGYAEAIEVACLRHGIPHWTPYQLRHAAKERVTRLFGLDHARAFLGQESIEAANGYARQQDLEMAKKVARRAG